MGTDVNKRELEEALPTVAGFAVREAIAALKERGIASTRLLSQCGLLIGGTHNPRSRISASAQCAFLELTAQALNDSAFGLRLAERTNPRAAGLLFYVASAAANISEALKLFARYFRIVNEAVRLNLTPTSEGEASEFEFPGLPRHGARQNTEFGIALLIKALREAAGRKICPTRVLFVHARNSNQRHFERFFGCPVEFGARRDRVFFSSETLAVPLATEDVYLLETLKPICEEAARERKTRKNTLRIVVENEVQKLLPHGKARRREVARALMMSERTLSRRLADEGTSFDEVLDQVRRGLALQYVVEEDISFAQISWLLGYEGSTSFNHAFKRWTGNSPSEARHVMERESA